MYTFKSAIEKYQDQFQFFAYRPGFGGETIASLVTSLSDGYVKYKYTYVPDLNKTKFSNRYWNNRNFSDLYAPSNVKTFIETDATDIKNLIDQLDNQKKFLSIWHSFDPVMVMEFPDSEFIYSEVTDRWDSMEIMKLNMIKVLLTNRTFSDMHNSMNGMIVDKIAENDLEQIRIEGYRHFMNNLNFWKEFFDNGCKMVLYYAHIKKRIPKLFDVNDITELSIEFLKSDEAVIEALKDSSETERFRDDRGILSPNHAVSDKVINYDKVCLINYKDISNPECIEDAFRIVLNDKVQYRTRMESWKSSNQLLLSRYQNYFDHCSV